MLVFTYQTKSLVSLIKAMASLMLCLLAVLTGAASVSAQVQSQTGSVTMPAETFQNLLDQRGLIERRSPGSLAPPTSPFGIPPLRVVPEIGQPPEGGEGRARPGYPAECKPLCRHLGESCRERRVCLKPATQ